MASNPNRLKEPGIDSTYLKIGMPVSFFNKSKLSKITCLSSIDPKILNLVNDGPTS